MLRIQLHNTSLSNKHGKLMPSCFAECDGFAWLDGIDGDSFNDIRPIW